MATPLILRGNFKIATVDQSLEVTAFKIRGARDTVEVPATLGGPKSQRAGGALYEVEISYLATDGTDGVLFPTLWTALGTATGEVAASASMRDGAISAANPEWQFTMVVTAAELGGEAEGLSTGSATFPLTGAPVIDITP
jgi:hypothetical protein